MVKVRLVPQSATRSPAGLIVPCGPAEAVTVTGWQLISPSAKSLNEVSPVACVLVAVLAPTVG